MAALRPAIEQVLATVPAHGNRAHNRHLDSRAVYDLATEPAIVERMACLYGPDLLLWRTNFFVKNCGSKAIPWHQDFNYWPLEPPVIISAFAVDPSTRQNGNRLAPQPRTSRPPPTCSSRRWYYQPLRHPGSPWTPPPGRTAICR